MIGNNEDIFEDYQRHSSKRPVSWFRMLICRLVHWRYIYETNWRFGYTITCDRCDIESYYDTDSY